MQFPITIGLHRSRILDGILLLVVVLAFVVCLSWPASIEIRLAGLLVILGGAWRIFRQLKPELPVVRLGRAGDFSAIANGSGEFAQLQALPGMVVHSWLTVIRFRSEAGERFMLVLTLDSTGTPEEFRRLRVFMRWRAMPSGATSDAG